MSNIEVSQQNDMADMSTSMKFAVLSAQIDKLQAEQAMQTEKLSEMIEAIEELPDAEAWSSQRVRIADFDIPF